jgi:hypothetical protein
MLHTWADCQIYMNESMQFAILGINLHLAFVQASKLALCIHADGA